MGCGSSTAAAHRSTRATEPRIVTVGGDESDSDTGEVVQATFDASDLAAFQSDHLRKSQQEDDDKRRRAEQAERDRVNQETRRREDEERREKDYEAFEEEQRQERERIAAEARARNGESNVLTL